MGPEVLLGQRLQNLLSRRVLLRLIWQVFLDLRVVIIIISINNSSRSSLGVLELISVGLADVLAGLVVDAAAGVHDVTTLLVLDVDQAGLDPLYRINAALCGAVGFLPGVVVDRDVWLVVVLVVLEGFI